MKKPNPELSRRELLKALAIGGGAVAAVTVAGQVSAAAEDAKPSEPEQGGRHYRETDHVRNYYASLRR